uniref:phenylalanine-tRNA ligase beta subunit n=1 Tax=Gracilaria urvillei TaxID=172974 RepID=UPI001D1016D2|nr:phenylalanine-tRNA ligase beta subunit [Hydropuntia urvillei]UAD88517.1 phenylalanine-tRNA ligase beta subunit [Hydropuntia urvillei]
MKFSLKWLQQVIDLNDIKFSTISNKLTLSGFEIENVIYNTYTNDIVFDLTTTTNRQDVLSVIGIAREISCLFDKPLKSQVYDSVFVSDFESLNLLDSISLSDVYLMSIDYVKNNSSPSWLQEYLSSQNIEPVNLLIDIPKYIYLKWGQFIQIFDKNKISASAIDYTLFNVQKRFDKLYHIDVMELESLRYNNLLLSTIGLFINSSIDCDIFTSSVIIVGQVYKTDYIKNLQKILPSNTSLLKKSFNFGLKIDCINAFHEAIQLIRSFSFGISGKMYVYYKYSNIPKIIVLKKINIQNILGSVRKGLYHYLTVKEIIHLLEKLNFITFYDNLKRCFLVKIPPNRINDITRPIDIIEEISRIYGFNNFISKLPIISSDYLFTKNTFRNRVCQIRYLLRCLGLNEVQNYSFCYDKVKKGIPIFNPLVQDQSFLRSSLIGNLVLNEQNNIKQGNKNIEIFEIGKVFNSNRSDKKFYNNSILPLEQLCLAGLIRNCNFFRESWSTKPSSLSWFHAKGIIEEFLDKLQVKVIWKRADILKKNSLFIHLTNLFNMNHTAIIYNDYKEEIGIFGELRNIDYIPTYVFEFHLIKLINSMKSLNHIGYKIKPYSSYPSLIRDLCLTLNDSHSVYSIQQEIASLDNDLVESTEVFNYYKNNFKHNYYNVGLRITYRAHDRTLNHNDVSFIDKQINIILNKYKVD